MSAIVAAAQRMERARLYTTTGIAGMMSAAGRAINAASNAAGAGRVVEGRPVKIRACTVDGCGGWIDGAEWHIRVPRKGWRPTRYGGARVWSTAAHDPRPCAWPRPFARGADR